VPPGEHGDENFLYHLLLPHDDLADLRVDPSVGLSQATDGIEIGLSGGGEGRIGVAHEPGLRVRGAAEEKAKAS
jgi:hypothetical protein